MQTHWGSGYLHCCHGQLVMNFIVHNVINVHLSGNNRGLAAPLSVATPNSWWMFLRFHFCSHCISFCLSGFRLLPIPLPCCGHMALEVTQYWHTGNQPLWTRHASWHTHILVDLVNLTYANSEHVLYQSCVISMLLHPWLLSATVHVSACLHKCLLCCQIIH